MRGLHRQEAVSGADTPTTDFPMTDTSTTPPGNDTARPDHDDLIRYQRIYLAGLSHAELNLCWERAYAHAMLLEQEPDRIHDDHGGLSGRQLGEGARQLARHYALLLAEKPARSAEVLKLKISVYQTLTFDMDEIRRTHTAEMIETAMHYDAAALGITLEKLPSVPAPGGSSH